MSIHPYVKMSLKIPLNFLLSLNFNSLVSHRKQLTLWNLPPNFSGLNSAWSHKFRTFCVFEKKLGKRKGLVTSPSRRVVGTVLHEQPLKWIGFRARIQLTVTGKQKGLNSSSIYFGKEKGLLCEGANYACRGKSVNENGWLPIPSDIRSGWSFSVPDSKFAFITAINPEKKNLLT